MDRVSKEKRSEIMSRIRSRDTQEENCQAVKSYYQDNHIRIYNKDCRSMDELPDESVQCVVTSPPYWGLRKYSGEQELIWGDNHCEHQWIDDPVPGEKSGPPGPNATVGARFAQDAVRRRKPTNTCSLCGAWKGAYGLEPTPEMYIEHTIEILREIRRVLRKDGVVFWNIGDSYARPAGKGQKFEGGTFVGSDKSGARQGMVGCIPSGLKEKDLCLIPFRVAIAAQEDGWWVRSVIIWSKTNPMPESVKDRPTESHEYILMLTKSARYYWDADAVREEYKQSSLDRADGSKVTTSDPDRAVRFKRLLGAGRNIRTVWEFPTKPGPGKEIRNFAVFPEKLPELCIKAATPEVGCCSKCGAPWARVLEKKPSQFNIRVRDAKAGRATPEEGYKATEEELARYPGNHPDPGYSRTVGWRPSCKCNAPRVPSLVLDPMMGAGTTLEEAKKLNRYAAGYELAEEYCQLAIERCRQQVLV